MFFIERQSVKKKLYYDISCNHNYHASPVQPAQVHDLEADSPCYTLPRLANVETMPKQGHKAARMSKSEYSGISRTVARYSNGKRNSHEWKNSNRRKLRSRKR